MVRKARLTSMAMVPGIAAVMMVAGCPFPEKPFGSGTPGAEPEPEKVCPIPVSATGQTPLESFTFFDPTTQSNRCYAIYKGPSSRNNALMNCQDLSIDEQKLGANLISISGLEEHVAIRNWLSELDSRLVSMDQDTFAGPWTRGVRDNNVGDPTADGAFYWDGPDDPNDENGTNEPWRIFPCSECACDGCGDDASLFWGNQDGNQPQPDSTDIANDSRFCVRYGISAPTWTDDLATDETDGSPGLADNRCSVGRAYICEWAL